MAAQRPEANHVLGAASTPAPAKVGGVLHTLTLRPGERLLHRATPSQLSNLGFFFLVLVLVWGQVVAVVETGSPQGGFLDFVIGTMAAYLYLKRALPFWYVTNERVVQVTLTNAGTFEEASVDLNRITSIVKHDPFFGSLLHLHRLDVFVAEGPKPKLSIRFQRNVDDLSNLLSPGDS